MVDFRRKKKNLPICLLIYTYYQIHMIRIRWPNYLVCPQVYKIKVYKVRQADVFHKHL